MSKVVLIIQARMTSTRLPGKSMMPLADKPLVYRMVERLKKCKKVDEIIIATSDQPEDKVLVDLANELGVSSFQGNLLDVRDRYLKAAEKSKADFIIRIPADNPMPDAIEIDKLIEFHLENNPQGFSSNLAQVNNSGYLDGIGSQESISEILGRLMPALMENENLAERLNGAFKILTENKVPVDQWKSWLAPLVMDQDEDMDIGFLRNSADEVTGFMVVAI
jgi:hypothetical protein